MAFSGSNVSLTEDGITLVYEAVAGDLEIWIGPYGGTPKDYFLGGSDVDDLVGLWVAGHSVFHTEVRPGDKIYAHTHFSGQRLSLLIRHA